MRQFLLGGGGGGTAEAWIHSEHVFLGSGITYVRAA